MKVPHQNSLASDAGETHGHDHVGGLDAFRRSGAGKRGAPVDGTVPDCTGDVVVRRGRQ